MEVSYTKEHYEEYLFGSDTLVLYMVKIQAQYLTISIAEKSQDHKTETPRVNLLLAVHVREKLAILLLS